MKKKPYARNSYAAPPKKQLATKRKDWYLSGDTFVSLWGSVRWHTRCCQWYGYVRDFRRSNHGSYHSGSSKAEEAMRWVEEQFALHERFARWDTTHD